MDEKDWLAERFEEHRGELRAVAYRMLGSLSEADDAVQEAWLRLSRADTSDVQNLGAWLTTVVGRVCLNMLRSRTIRREDPLGPHLPDPIITRQESTDPDVVLRADGGGRPGAAVIIRGGETVASQALMFAGPSRHVRPVLVNGAVGVLVTIGGQPVSVMRFTVADGKILAMDGLTDPARLSQLDLAALDD